MRLTALSRAIGLLVALVLLTLAVQIGGCRQWPSGSNNPSPIPSANESRPEGTGPDSEVAADLVPLSDLSASDLRVLNRPAKGDLKEIVERRRFIRALVVYSRTNYFIDGTEQRGAAYDSFVEFENWLRRKSSRRNVGLKVIMIPTTRDRLFRALAAGYGDIAMGNLKVTPEREKLVDFTDPLIDNVQEIVVTGPTAPLVTNLDDLSGQEVYVRATSSYRESLDKLNEGFRRRGKAPVAIRFADELLEDEDLIQMVDSGALGITVVDQYLAKFWTQLYDRAKIREDLVLRKGSHDAMAVRKDSPELKRLLNEFIRTHRAGTSFGNQMLKKYLGKVERLKNPAEQRQLERFRALAAHFRKYGDQYGIPWLLVAAQGYQESQLDQRKRSHKGAIGIMQIKPATARSVGILNIERAENNIEGGVKYLRFIVDNFFNDAPMDRVNKGLFALAAYNAGPARVAGLRKKAKELGLNPNVWFNNVEIVAARRIGREPVDYVSNIYKYYTTYLAIVETGKLDTHRKAQLTPAISTPTETRLRSKPKCEMPLGLVKIEV